MNYGEELSGSAAKRHAPSVARNVEPIRQVLAKELPQNGTVLEIASGTGEHILALARAFPSLDWRPSDCDDEALRSIAAHRNEASEPNLRPPVTLDASSGDWPVSACDAMLCINMAHISPWASTEGLFRGAEKLLSSGQPLILYGPFREEGKITAPSNEEFDRSLKRRNSDWGLRRVEDLDALADRHGLRRSARHEMPANNLMLIYRKV